MAFNSGFKGLKAYGISQKIVTSSKWLSFTITCRYCSKICLKILGKIIQNLSKYLVPRQNSNHVPLQCVSDEILFSVYEMSYLLLYME